MDNKENTNNYYVFSQTTLDLALQEWLVFEKEKNPKTEDLVMIALAAIPWFLKHLKQAGPTYMFTYDVLITELEVWKSLQIADYPHQKQRIEDTCEMMLNFFQSDLVIHHKMMIQTS